ncbi:Proton-dependent Oligopeptide Transporter [Phytophthora megakarya]|uniref:Proton-dependent Oligopeptide Transporter n=1 Tax=Phytophthora megakarya TaxID=4795 RepID=A0A225WZT5_9STRA|nr:Proton-dependent Oligopeptide Transporter [Phytophthora megakarya]
MKLTFDSPCQFMYHFWLSRANVSENSSTQLLVGVSCNDRYHDRALDILVPARTSVATTSPLCNNLSRYGKVLAGYCIATVAVIWTGCYEVIDVTLAC